MSPANTGSAPRWETAFVAVSTLAGEPPGAIAGALGEAGAAEAAQLVRALEGTSRGGRARSLARALSDVVLALDALRYA
jgi:hypothetical protein